jgi:hypothetical protein
MSNLVSKYSALDPADAEWLHLLVGDWQLISDLAFADLVLWLPTTDGGFVAVSQCRPSTGATVHHDDIVGSFAPGGLLPQLERALTEERTQRSREPRTFPCRPTPRSGRRSSRSCTRADRSLSSPGRPTSAAGAPPAVSSSTTSRPQTTS